MGLDTFRDMYSEEQGKNKFFARENKQISELHDMFRGLYGTKCFTDVHSTVSGKGGKDAGFCRKNDRTVHPSQMNSINNNLHADSPHHGHWEIDSVCPHCDKVNHVIIPVGKTVVRVHCEHCTHGYDYTHIVQHPTYVEEEDSSSREGA